jgi:hypothetical protein
VTYFYRYLGIGAVVLVSIALTHHLTKKNGDDLLSERLDYIHPEREKLWYRLLNDVIGPALLGLLIVPFWPVIVYFKIKQIIVGEPETTTFEDPKFSVTRADLLAKMSIPDIEDREMVTDPLGAAPHLPFGHLNPAWKKFLEEAQPSDEIWTFAVKWTRWGHVELRQGYVAVRGDELGPYFTTMYKYLEANEKPSSNNGKKAKFDVLSFLRKNAD